MPPVVSPYVPEQITVHLGPPSSDAANVTVDFSDYVKNVASSEIYPPGTKAPCVPIYWRSFLLL